MSWDLFSSAPGAPDPRRAGTVDGNEALAHAVAGAQADGVLEQPEPRADWTVSAVNAAARRLVEGFFPSLWIVGEVTNFTRARSGHCYFTLRDDVSQIRCVMWRDEARRLPTAPAEGMEVRALGRLTLYEARGEFQLVVSVLEGKGEGLWKLALERLKAKLDAEGLTAPGRKRALPRVPAVIGLVTSPSGAVLHDITTVVRRRAPWTRLVLCGCRVQGEGAAREIADAIRLFGRSGVADVLIVGRGGGSVEDLWAFNEEVVARAIAESPIPVISAVGHETDVTIADLVADLRAPTPSAAAEAAVPDGRALARELARLQGRMTAGLRARAEQGRREIAVRASLIARSAERLLARRRERMRAAGQRLHALSPLAALDRGFAIPTAPDGRILRRREDFTIGLRFGLRVRDGTVPVRVEEDSR
jgi:exodeoxyribonuclease VII large subunit